MIVGIVGRTTDPYGGVCTQGAGKDTVADMLVTTHGFSKMAFADAIKRIAQDVFDLTDIQVWGESQYRSLTDARYGVSTRDILWDLGDAGRKSCEDIWVQKAVGIAKRLLRGGCTYTGKYGLIEPPEQYRKDPDYVPAPPPTGVVFTDVRYWNELACLKKLGAKIIMVTRPTVDRLPATALAHPT